MNIRKEIGKITSIKLGTGGYQDAMFGVSIGLGSSGWGVADFKGTWNLDIKSQNAKWTEKDRDEIFSETMRWISDTMSKAKVHNFQDLVDTPVEVVFENNTLKSWRVLEEVL